MAWAHKTDQILVGTTRCRPWPRCCSSCCFWSHSVPTTDDTEDEELMRSAGVPSRWGWTGEHLWRRSWCRLAEHGPPPGRSAMFLCWMSGRWSTQRHSAHFLGLPVHVMRQQISPAVCGGVVDYKMWGWGMKLQFSDSHNKINIEKYERLSLWILILHA